MSYKHNDSKRNGEFRETSLRIVGKTLGKKLDTMIDDWNPEKEGDKLGSSLPAHGEGNYCPLLDMGCERNRQDKEICNNPNYMHCYSLIIGGLLGF